MDTNDLVDESLPPVVDSRQLEDDLDSLRMLFTWLIGITIIVAAGIGYVVIKNWLQDSMVSGPPAELLANQAAFNQLIQLDEVDGLTGQGVTMCIVDSGIDMSHEALKNVNLAGWKDFIGNETEAYDDQGHGTMMAGIIVAGDGMKSVAPNVELYVAKALAKNGSGSDAGVSDAIDWCVDQGADIISLSLGGAPGIIPSAFEGSSSSSAARDAIDAGILVVAAAGNDGDEPSDDNVDSPGGEEDVICVGAVDRHGNLWAKSSKGDNNGNIWPVLLPRNDPDKKPELVAPGMDIPVILPDNRYGYSSGTSASTAFVSGALSLLLEDRPDLQHDGSAGGGETVENIKQWLMDSVHPKSGQTDHDDHYGYGMLQILALLDAANN
ncbi:S8 family serine peptidase [Deltaproteobacteria bacterium]|nr:S8 family serine peptidase [Deltaproteobacteria bacterium]